MASPIHHHHSHFERHHLPIFKPSEDVESKVIPIHDPDKPQDVLETGNAPVNHKKKAKTPTLLDTLLNGRITVGSYEDHVELPKNKLKQKLYENDQILSTTNNKLNAAKMDAAQSLGALQAELQTLATAEQSVVNTEITQISAINTAATAYNSQITPGDANALSTLNYGTSLYNAGQINQADYLNNYVSPYNNYVTGNDQGTGSSGRNATIQGTISSYQSAVQQYNAQVPVVNGQIDSINALISSLNATLPASNQIPAFPSELVQAQQATALLPVVNLPLPATPAPQQNPTTPFPPPVPSQGFLVDPRTALSLSSVPTPINPTSFFQTYYAPIFNAATAGAHISNKQRDRIVAQQDYQRFFLRGKKVFAPDTNVDAHPKMSEGAGGGGFRGGGGVAFSAIGAGSSSTHAEGLNANAIFSINQDHFQLGFTQPKLAGLRNLVTLYGLLQLLPAGLQAAISAIHGLKLEGLTPHAALLAFKVTSGISTAASLIELVTSGRTGDSIKQALQLELKGTADQKTIDRTVDILTAELNIALLQNAGIIASIALQTPGLPQHLTANIGGLSPGAAHVALSPDKVLQDPFSVRFTIDTLANTLAREQEISTPSAQALVNQAITSALATGPLQTEAELRQALIRSFIAEKITKKDAEILADQAAFIVRQESTSTRILHDQVFNKGLDIHLLTNQLEQSGLSKEAARTLATQVVDQVLQNGGISSDAQFQAAVQIQLQQYGIQSSSAGAAASNVVVGISAATSAKESPLESPDSPAQLEHHHLRRQVARQTENLLAETIGLNEARRHGHRAVELLIGAPGSKTSLLGLLEKNIEIIKRESGGRAEGAILISFRDFISPNIDAFVFNRKIMDPANTFLLSAMTSSRLSDLTEPKNYIKYLDFYV